MIWILDTGYAAALRWDGAQVDLISTIDLLRLSAAEKTGQLDNRVIALLLQGQPLNEAVATAGAADAVRVQITTDSDSPDKVYDETLDEGDAFFDPDDPDIEEDEGYSDNESRTPTAISSGSQLQAERSLERTEGALTTPAAYSAPSRVTIMLPSDLAHEVCRIAGVDYGDGEGVAKALPILMKCCGAEG